MLSEDNVYQLRLFIFRMV